MPCDGDGSAAPAAGGGRGVAEELRALVAALQFLTRLPLPAVAFRPALLARGALYFPLVGLVVGALGSAVWLLAALWWPPAVAAALAIVAMLLVTGGFHEDGLADTADGLGGGWTAADKLRIMRDSRIGTYGGLALGVVLLLRYAVLSGLAPAAVAVALPLSQMLGRWSTLPLVAASPYVGGGSGRALVQGISGARVVLATLFVAALAGLAAPRLFAALALLSAVAVLLAARLFRRQLGGITGDALGAANVALELLVLLAFAAGG